MHPADKSRPRNILSLRKRSTALPKIDKLKTRNNLQTHTHESMTSLACTTQRSLPRNDSRTHIVADRLEKTGLYGNKQHYNYLTQHQTPRRKTAAELRKELDFDVTFRAEMDEVIHNIDCMKGKRAQVFSKLKSAETFWDEDRGHDGILGGREAKRRL